MFAHGQKSRSLPGNPGDLRGLELEHQKSGMVKKDVPSATRKVVGFFIIFYTCLINWPEKLDTSKVLLIEH